MTQPQRKRPPGGGPGLSLAAGNPNPDYTPIARAATKALAAELGIVLSTAHRMAAGHGLAWSDYDRLHDAHQHIIRVLADLTGREVLL